MKMKEGICRLFVNNRFLFFNTGAVPYLTIIGRAFFHITHIMKRYTRFDP